MNKKIELIKKEFSQKQELLENAANVLKTEFVGIDSIIDEIISSVSSWFFLSDLQERPIIINLWGLTGVGKTSLVKRLTELIKFDHRFYRFDLGVKEGSYSFRESLGELCENKDDSPLIIALDEFQHSRTLKQDGLRLKETSNDENRMVWELIDSGKVQYLDWQYGIWDFEAYIHILEKLIFTGLSSKNGMVTKGKALYLKEISDRFRDDDEPIRLVPEGMYADILKFAGDALNMLLLKDVERHVLGLTTNETLEFLHKVLKIAKKPTIRNFSKSLIFVLGNLDEAYNMSGNMSADIDADDFHKESLKITVPTIKKALKTRFRLEQISRLGNTHIIYPAFSKNTYLDIIKNELEKTCSSLSDKLQLAVKYDNSIIDLVYSEGVYPTQGARPIFTTINQVFKSKFIFFMSKLLTNKLKVDTLLFSISSNQLKCNYQLNDSTIYSAITEISTPLYDLRKPKQNDLQAIVAVHESGHVILSSLLLKTLPEIVYSTTSDANTKGTTYFVKPWDYTSRKEILYNTAVNLGGLAAEELIFGKENVSSGSSGDIKQTFDSLSTHYKENGMGEHPILYGMEHSQNENSYHKFEEVEENIKAVVLQAFELAKATLKKEHKLLLALSDRLSDARMLKKEEVRGIIDTYCTTETEYITDADHLFYRAHLKKAVEQSQVKLLDNYFDPISLNKK